MNPLRRLLAWLCAGLTALSVLPALAQGESDVEGAAARQLLVLLALPPAHFRPDAGYAGGYGDGLGAAARRRAAARIAREHGLALGIDWPMPSLGLHCYVMTLAAGDSPAAALRALESDPDVAWAQPMHVYRAQAAAPGDPLYAAQPTALAWRLDALHRLATGRDVRVAVVDSAVEADHPDLAGQIVLAANFVVGRPPAGEAHGTAVAGLIAARADDGVGIAGVAPGARVLALRACRQRTPSATLCDTLGLAMALQAALTHDADVINLSLAGPPDRLLAALIDAALARGTVVVAAADRTLADGGFPAAHRGVVGVVDDADGPAAPGRLAAPGRDLPAPVPPAGWQLVSGASYAAAQVSGLFALLRERRGAGAALGAASIVQAGGAVDALATLRGPAGPATAALTP
ncbi:MAG TPA: S8 family serine peptidase [Ideonella sp.]|nr:S8 family serine peptidase [Ideonella sp.]